MSQELFYTSAPRGLRPGSRGFCTVAATRGMSAALLEKLESLSGYRPLYPPLDPKAALNPVAYSHQRLSVAGKTYHVLSRIGPAGLDYTERSNKFAHHVVLEPGELPEAGPAWLLQQHGFMEAAWDGQVKVLEAGRSVPQGTGAPGVCRAWEALTGDAGWAGVLAEAFQQDPNRPAYLVFEPGMEVLPLVAEALALLPVARRWDVTFSTYFTGLPQGLSCLWRATPGGPPEIKNARRFPDALIVHLRPDLGEAPKSKWAARARGLTSCDVEREEAVCDEADPLRRVLQTKEAIGTDPGPFHTAARSSFGSGGKPVTLVPSPPPLHASTGRAPGSGRWKAWLAGAGAGAAATALVIFACVAVGLHLGILHLSRQREPLNASQPRELNLRPVELARAGPEPEPAKNGGTVVDAGPPGRVHPDIREPLRRLLSAAANFFDLLSGAIVKAKEREGPRNPVTAAGKPAEPAPLVTDRPPKSTKKLIKVAENFPLPVSTIPTEVTVRLEPEKRDFVVPQKEQCELRLLGLKEVDGNSQMTQEADKKEGSLSIFFGPKEGPNKLIARFSKRQKDNKLVFKWEDVTGDDAVNARTRIRNAVLEIRSGSRHKYAGLMWLREKEPNPRIWSLTKEPQVLVNLKRGSENYPQNPLILEADVTVSKSRKEKSLTGQLGPGWDEPVVIRVDNDRQQVVAHLAKIPGVEPERREKKDRPELSVRSLVVSMEVHDKETALEVEIYRFDVKAK